MDIGYALKYYRKLSGMTQSQVAEGAEVNEKYYGEVERNESSPTIDRLEKICGALGVNIAQIVSYVPLRERETRITFFPETKIREEYYCNCCGTYFFYSGDEDAICPECGCEFDEENDFIERYS